MEPLRIRLILSRTIFVLWPNNPHGDVHRADFLWLALWAEKIVKQSNKKMFEGGGRFIMYSKEELIGQDMTRDTNLLSKSARERDERQVRPVISILCQSRLYIVVPLFEKRPSFGKTFSKKVSYFILLTVVALCCFV